MSENLTVKLLLQRFAKKYGYEIRKAPSGFQPLPVFKLALQYLLLTRGDQLTFIEVGANDGISGDPLREFIVKYPWKGVLVEPQPDVFETLRSNYAGFEDRVCFENVAISKSSAPIEMYRLPKNFKTKHGGPTIASSDPRVTAKQSHTKTSNLEKITVPTAMLDTIVQKHGLTDLDLLQLDTEGFDWDVLQTLNLNQTRPWMIGFEHGHLSPATIRDMVRHLNQHGYLVHFGGYQTDSVAVREDFITV